MLTHSEGGVDRLIVLAGTAGVGVTIAAQGADTTAADLALDGGAATTVLTTLSDDLNPVPIDNLWGKGEAQAVADLAASGNPQVGRVQGATDVELAVDPYFPRTIPTVPDVAKGLTAHLGGRNRLFLDGHVKWLRDVRTG